MVGSASCIHLRKRPISGHKSASVTTIDACVRSGIMVGRSFILPGAMARRRSTFWSLAFVIAFYPAIAGAQTSHVSLVLDERGVTLDAREATLREVFSEWERV